MSTKLHESERRSRLVNRFRSHVPPLPPGGGPPRRPRRLEVFAVGTTWVQVTWSALGPGPVQLRSGPVRIELETDGGPGAATLHGLAPDSAHEIEVIGAGVPAQVAPLRARTLLPPPGELLHRIATVSDTHLGAHSAGFFNTIIEKPRPGELHPVRCARAALAEARQWGADELVVKGDLVDHSEPASWACAAEVLREVAAPVSIVPGNHEWSVRGDGDPAAGLAAHGFDLVVGGVEHHDRPGVRVVLVDSTIPGADPGRLDAVLADTVDLAADTALPLLVAMHHQPMRLPVPTYMPAGVPGPDANRFLGALGRANPRTLVTSGHTHRHRRRHHGPVTITEVGSTQDFPGTWAAYEVYEGGIVQTVRRIAEPGCIRWTDHTRRAALGVWQLWSPGRLTDRCFTRTW